MVSTGRKLLTLLLLTCFPILIDAQESQPWTTHYQRYDFAETGTLAETEDFARRLAAFSPLVHFQSAGKSAMGRDIPLIIVDPDQQFTAVPAATRRKPVILIQSAIHAGEIAGKDASLLFLQDLIVKNKYPDLLQATTLLFIPVFNVDGHENTSNYNRPNQVGPRTTGYRATAQGYNLNRDFLKAESPEMKAWINLFNEWQPDFLIDNHTTDGADFQYSLTYGLETQQMIAEPLRKWTREKLEPQLTAAMTADNMPIFPYFRLKQRPDIRKGVVAYPLSPRFSTGYGAARNRVFFLAETHALKPYHVRVDANYALIKNLLLIIGSDPSALIKANIRANHLTARKLSGTIMPLAVKVDMEDSMMVDFSGYASKIVNSELSGGKWVQYSDQPESFRLPHFFRTITSDSATIPFAYLIPPQWQKQIEMLQRHGIHIERLSQPTELEVTGYRFSNVQWKGSSFEGHLMTSFEQSQFSAVRTFPANSAVVFMQQTDARVAAHLLEPRAPDSFVKWGFWNTIFERKEYAEDYYLEELAREMIASDPELKQRYQQEIEAHPEKYPNYWARLYYFYAQSPYWEHHVNLYPVGKLMKSQHLSLAPRKPLAK